MQAFSPDLVNYHKASNSFNLPTQRNKSSVVFGAQTIAAVTEMNCS